MIIPVTSGLVKFSRCSLRQTKFSIPKANSILQRSNLKQIQLQKLQTSGWHGTAGVSNCPARHNTVSASQMATEAAREEVRVEGEGEHLVDPATRQAATRHARHTPHLSGAG